MGEVQGVGSSGASPTRPGVLAEADGDSRALVRAVFDSALDAVIVIDHEGRVLEFSRSAEKVFGYARREVLGRRLEELIIPPRLRERHRRGLARTLERGDAPLAGRRMELAAIRASGAEFPAEVTVGRLELEGDPRFIGFIRDLTEKKRAEDEVQQHRERLRALASQLSLAEERERRRIALGLHDRIGHALALAKLRLGELREAGRPEAVRRTLQEVRELLDEALGETRSLSFELSSPVLYEVGLEAALRGLGRQVAERHGVRFRFSSDGERLPLTEDCRVILYRAVEELLMNVVKHSGASHARVAMERVGDEIRIRVEDDGSGLAPEAAASPQAAGGLGLFGIRERLNSFGGRLTIEAGRKSGARIALFAPLDLEKGWLR